MPVAARSADADKRTLSTEIARKLGEEIENGAYAPGDKLRESEIAVRFGASRGPVREALRLLSRNGIVELRPRHGAYIRVFSSLELCQINELRTALFEMAVRLFARGYAAGTVSPETDREFRDIFRGLLDDADEIHASEAIFARVARRGRSFLLANCGNDLINQEHVRLDRQMHIYYMQLTHQDARYRTKIIGTLRVMIDAILAGEEETASRMAVKIGEQNQQQLVKHFEGLSGAVPAPGLGSA
jgi:DNA-binding GntR family transcriptional regulator